MNKTLTEEEINKLENRRKEEINYLERNSTGLKETASMLNIKSKTFINYLIENKYLYKSNIVKKNIAYDKYTTQKGNCLFYVKIEDNYYNGYKNIQTKVTPKGMAYFKNKLKVGENA